MRAKLGQAQKLAGTSADIHCVESAEAGLALVVADIQRFDLLLVSQMLSHRAKLCTSDTSGNCFVSPGR